MLMSAALLALLNHAKFFKIRISLYSAELYHKTAVQLSLKLIKVGNKENWVDKQQEKKKTKKKNPPNFACGHYYRAKITRHDLSNLWVCGLVCLVDYKDQR